MDPALSPLSSRHSFRIPPRRTGRAVLLVTLLMAMTLLPPGPGRAEPGDIGAVQARVVEVYNDRAIVEIDGRRLLVEPIAAGQPFPAEPGALIEIVGRVRGNVLAPSRITLPSGAVIAPPAQAGRGIAEQLAAHGISVEGRPYRRRNQTVVAGRAADGRGVIAAFDHNLRLTEIEDADHRHVHPSAPEALPEAEVTRRLAGLGYTAIRLIDQSRFRFLFAATGPKGERMELHVDRAGAVFRRVWLQ